jgi:hypothetical protein
VRKVVVLVVLVAVTGFGWVFSLPNQAECVASGRIVDPTERHCVDGNGFVQLEEHALFHSREVVLGAGILLAIGYAAQRYRRRRSAAPAA